MAAEFVDYKRGPGFWFLFELLVAVDISEKPFLSASLSDLLPLGPDEDLYSPMDEGLKIYEMIQKKKLLLGW